MHAGFRELRQAMWMNLGRDFAGLGRTPGALADIARIEALWAETRQRFGAGGPYLFGAAFTAPDVMYAPVVTRFLTWKPELTPETRAYCDAVRAHELVAALVRRGRGGTGGMAGRRVRNLAMSNAAALDHVGVVGRDVAVLAAEFENLGFCLTPLARHAGGRTGNRNVMLRRGYIELLSVVDGGSSATLERFLARYAGIHILSLAIADETAASGTPAPRGVRAGRRVADRSGRGRRRSDGATRPLRLWSPRPIRRRAGST